jgi:hypothetical protein
VEPFLTLPFIPDNPLQNTIGKIIKIVQVRIDGEGKNYSRQKVKKGGSLRSPLG